MRTRPQIAEVFHNVTGIPTRFEEQPLEEVRGFSQDLGLMFQWLNDRGYRADIATLRDRHPQLRTLRSWLQETAWQPTTPA